MYSLAKEAPVFTTKLSSECKHVNFRVSDILGSISPIYKLTFDILNV